MKHLELRQFILESNREKLSPAEKDVFLYYQSRAQSGKDWKCRDDVVADEIGRSRNTVCVARNELKSRGWIREIVPFTIAVIKQFSVRNVTEASQDSDSASPKPDSSVRNETQPVRNVTAYKDKNKQENLEENSQEKENPREKTEITAMDADELGYPYTELFAAFPDLILVPAQAGTIDATIGDSDTDRTALKNTISKYLGNRNGSSYNPGKMGTFLSVFRDEKMRLERNATNRNNGPSKPTGGELIENRPYR